MSLLAAAFVGTAVAAPPSNTGYKAPVVSSVSPNTGLLTGGTSVTITGSNFTGATSVKFGSLSALTFTVVSSTKITATSPPGIGTVDVTVTGPGGTSRVSRKDRFTYTP